MTNPTGDDSHSAQDKEERERELLCLKIKAHLEDLFSDIHLAEDGFLLKHVQKNKEGYVSLKLLTCLKKIKALTTNWYVTLAGAEYSDLLEVNDKCTKVRRKKPLPKWLLCSPTSKLLLAWNIHEVQTREDGAACGLEHLSLSERILQKFSAHGSVTSVCILHPGKELPKELQCYTKRHKELGQHLCAVVKFDSLEAVRKAYSVLKAEEESSQGKGMCVVPLGFRSMHHITKDDSEEKNEDQAEGTPSQENHFETSEHKETYPPVKVSDEIRDTSQPQNTFNSSFQKTFEHISASCNSKSFFSINQRYSRMSWCSGDCNKEISQSPWVMKHKFAASALNHKAGGHPNAPYLEQRVLRQPFGPDGTRGFKSRKKLLQQEEIQLSRDPTQQRSTTC